MVGSVNVASRLDTAILMQGLSGDTGEENDYTIVGIRDPGAINGYGITYGIDRSAFMIWLAMYPQFTNLISEATDDQIADGLDPAKTHGYEIGLEEQDPPPTDPPVNVDVPYVEQQSRTLICTMGNWNNVPNGYSYQWQIDGVDAGRQPTYLVRLEDVGLTATCTVTATNAIGSTTAPPSNSVVIA